MKSFLFLLLSFFCCPLRAMFLNCAAPSRFFSVLCKSRRSLPPCSSDMIQRSFSFDSVMPEKQIAIAKHMRELDQAKHDRASNGAAAVMVGVIDSGGYVFDMPIEVVGLVGTIAMLFSMQSLKHHIQVCAKKDILDMLHKTN
ncbi:MAG: hypothetical protein WD055_00325 [Candidatus Dependentiae bacterium]